MYNSPLNLIQLLSQGHNSQQLCNQLMNSNPNFRMMMNQVQNSGMSTKDYVLNYARQHNINIDPMISMLNNRGIKL